MGVPVLIQINLEMLVSASSIWLRYLTLLRNFGRQVALRLQALL
jgi:hypothetical protein